MKKAIAKTYRYSSAFGEAVFRNVPVLVDDDFRGKTVDPDKDDCGLTGNVIMAMEREVAKGWLRDRADPLHLKSREIESIRVLCGLNQTEMAALLRLTKGSMSKILKGALKLRPPMSDLCLLILAYDLTEPGSVKRDLHDDLLGLVGEVPKPSFDLKRMRA